MWKPGRLCCCCIVHQSGGAETDRVLSMCQPARNAPTQHGEPQQPVAAWDASAVDPSSGRKSQSLILGGGVRHWEQQHGEWEGELRTAACCDVTARLVWHESVPLPVHNQRITHISRLNCLCFISLACGDYVCFCSHALKSWRRVHQGPCHRPRSSSGESQTLTKRRRN